MKNKIKNLKKWAKVEIEWVDSSHASGWQDSKEIEGTPQIDHRTLGYVLQTTVKTISVVQSVSDYLREDNSRNVDSVMDIPKVAIKKIRYLS